MSDAEFDRLSLEIDLSKTTSNQKMDSFFKKHFNPSTGVWIRKHPELDKLRYLYYVLYKKEELNELIRRSICR